LPAWPVWLCSISQAPNPGATSNAAPELATCVQPKQPPRPSPTLGRKGDGFDEREVLSPRIHIFGVVLGVVLGVGRSARSHRQNPVGVGCGRYLGSDLRSSPETVRSERHGCSRISSMASLFLSLLLPNGRGLTRTSVDKRPASGLVRTRMNARFGPTPSSKEPPRSSG
jgi:hypothetical protein